MPTTALIRVSFQSDGEAHNEVRRVLERNGPFTLVNTAVYHCDRAGDQAVVDALAQLGQVLARRAATIDFLSVNLTRHAQ